MMQPMIGEGKARKAPGSLVSTLENPQAPVSDEARDAFTGAASACPEGEQVVDRMVRVARQALYGSIHRSFVFVLFSALAAIAAAFVIKAGTAENNGEPTGKLLLDAATEGQVGAARR